jgi:hypothetical protein
MTSSLKKLLPTRAVATRYDVCIKSVDRWLERKSCPSRSASVGAATGTKTTL